MDIIIKKFNNYPWSLPFTAWLLFSFFYWYAAYFKPFTSNGFISWVYASRCTYYEILTLKDTGIGHPPFFHILQKLVQDIIPGYHFLYVRLVNYILGSLFIVFLSNYLIKFKRNIFFILSISISAAVLNAFVYARMWAGMALFSLILVILGESFIVTKKRTYISLMIMAILLGLFYDYNFILMVPYVFYIIINQSKHKDKLGVLAFSSLILLWIIAFGISISKFGLSMSIYTNLINIYKMSFNLFNLVFYSWYVEFIILIMLFLFGILFLQYRKKEFNEFYVFLSILLFLGFIFLFINTVNFRIRYALFFLPFPILFYFFIKKRQLYDAFNSRFLFSILFGSMMILVISPLFWRDLVINRFIIIFLPLVIILFYRNLSNKVLNALSIFFILSGVMFSSSSFLNDSYLPRAFASSKKNIFENPGFYASQYLKKEIQTQTVPKFSSLANFDFGCRVCTMGTDEIDYSQLDSIHYVSYDQLPINLLLKGYKIKNAEIFGLTKLDKFQLKYLTPINRNYSILYEMVKKHEKTE